MAEVEEADLTGTICASLEELCAVILLNTEEREGQFVRIKVCLTQMLAETLGVGKYAADMLEALLLARTELLRVAFIYVLNYQDYPNVHCHMGIRVLVPLEVLMGP